VAPPWAAVKKVLIIEDNEDCRAVLLHLLRTHGFDARAAADGREGLKAALAGAPDLVLLDFDLPGLNGYEVLTGLRMNDALRHVPVLMLTGTTKVAKLSEVAFHAQGVLAKPISPEALLAAVNRALGLEATQKPASPPDQEWRQNESLRIGARALELDAAASAAGGGGSPWDGLTLDATPRPASAGELETSAAQISVITRVNQLLVQAVSLGASDIHFEPQDGPMIVRARVDGTLREISTCSGALQPSIVARIKILADLVITERRLPQDGQFRASYKGRAIAFRVSTIPSKYGEKIVIRVLAASLAGTGLGRIGMAPHDIESTEIALRGLEGLILTTGPTSSGKTTTLYSMLSAINSPGVNIMTVEDPVEYQLPGITQIQVNPAIGLSFESVLRSTLRQDPNVILIGEIRDKETAEIAVKAALTGHLVLSSLHTASAPKAINRLMQMGLEPYLLASAVKLLISQRLLRRLCPACKVPAVLSDKERKHLSEEEAGLVSRPFRCIGCKECSQTGYVGRVALYETMSVRTPQMRAAIASSAPLEMIRTLALREGMSELRSSALQCVAAGEVSLNEAMRIILAA
jgi:type II secretory ATPase GspE/PulE/Tfp pilus assembly ATPase PilB-like protein/CheY-like chemotaxis protein